MLPFIKTVSVQTSAVYKLLSNGRALSAQEIAEELGTLPNAVYRVAQKLVSMGMVEQLDSYPVRFKALPAQTALSLYMVAATQNFKREFGLTQTAATVVSDVPTISLIKDRPSLLRREEVDVRAATQSVDFIVSGHEVPDATMLAFRKAVTIGVPVRMIIHQSSQINSRQTAKWKEIGVQIRYLPDFEMRLFIFDKQTVYMTSYDTKKPNSAFGVRFAYVPLALQMSEVFEQNWQKAKKL